MAKILCSFETPISMLDISYLYNDYTFALTHLLSNEKYKNYLKQQIKQERLVMLDNSFFELDNSIKGEEFAKQVLDIKPQIYVIPDGKTYEETITLFRDWNKNLKKDVPGGTIAVVKGDTYEEQKQCYLEMIKDCDIIAVPLDLGMLHLKQDAKNGCYTQEYLNQSVRNRSEFLKTMFMEGHLDIKKPTHLLGCTLMKEFIENKDFYNMFVRSVDTSCPTRWGLLNQDVVTFDKDNKIQLKTTKPKTMFSQEEMEKEMSEELKMKVITNGLLFKALI